MRMSVAYGLFIFLTGINILLAISNDILNCKMSYLSHLKKRQKVCLWIRLITANLLCAWELWQNNALLLQFWCLSNGLHPPFRFVHLPHQNFSARALFCLNSLAKVNMQWLIHKYHILTLRTKVRKEGELARRRGLVTKMKNKWMQYVIYSRTINQFIQSFPRWNYLLAYNLFVILIKVALQLGACAYLTELLDANLCWLFQLLGVVCLQNGFDMSKLTFIKGVL